MQSLESSLLLALVASLVVCSQARSFPTTDDASISGVIPSPNQDEDSYSGLAAADIQRASAAMSQQQPTRATGHEHSAQPSGESSIPIYVSPFARAERGATQASSSSFDRAQESSLAPPNYVPRPAAAAAGTNYNDLKTSASYGHGHHQGHGYGHDHSGWLDMGAWTGGKGSFGWYADYPVGGKHGYGRK